MHAAHRRFFWILLLCFSTTLLPILALNFILVSRSLDNQHGTQLASQWQRSTQGVVNAPSQLDNGQFKLLGLHDQLPNINTVVFGASTSFGITQEMFPESMRIYNFSKNGVDLSVMIAEAEYLMTHDNGVKWLFMPLDWSIGFIYRDSTPQPLDLGALPQAQSAARASVSQIIYDALSYPRIEGLFGLLKLILQSDDRWGAFRQIFLQDASDEYKCPDGTLAKDFDIQGRGKCRGFRSDGSWTYYGIGRVSDPSRLIMMATTSNSKYAQNLLKTQGKPNAVYLKRLGAIARLAEQRGGGLVLFMPPLLSGMESEFLHHPTLAQYLRTTKQALSSWAAEENVVLIDAGQAEKFGCATQEFSDEHHAAPSCYQKIFATFWHNPVRPNGLPLLPRSQSIFKEAISNHD